MTNVSFLQVALPKPVVAHQAYPLISDGCEELNRHPCFRSQWHGSDPGQDKTKDDSSWQNLAEEECNETMQHTTFVARMLFLMAW